MLYGQIPPPKRESQESLMRKPLMVVAAAALSVASLAGCKLDVSPVEDNPAVGATTINGDGTTIFSVTDTRLGTYRSSGSVDGDEACTWKLFENDNNDAGDEQQVRLKGDNLYDGDDADTDEDDVNADLDQTFQLREGDARFVSTNCKTFVRIGD